MCKMAAELERTLIFLGDKVTEEGDWKRFLGPSEASDGKVFRQLTARPRDRLREVFRF